MNSIGIIHEAGPGEARGRFSSRDPAASSLHADRGLEEMAVYPGIGHCIYCCASGPLQREHIIAKALGGERILLEASCESCAGITSGLERAVLRTGNMWPLRGKLGLSSYQKYKENPKAIPFFVVADDEKKVELIPTDEASILLPFPKFDVPAFISPHGYHTGIRVSGLLFYCFGDNLDEYAAARGWKEMTTVEVQRPVEFAKMLAKIGWAAAVAGREHLKLTGPPFVLPAILGGEDDIGRWVGGHTDPLETPPGSLHRVNVIPRHDLGVLLASIQLFANSGTPNHGVALGPIR
jgi:hypothetical protein